MKGVQGPEAVLNQSLARCSTVREGPIPLAVLPIIPIARAIRAGCGSRPARLTERDDPEHGLRLQPHAEQGSVVERSLETAHVKVGPHAPRLLSIVGDGNEAV